MLLLQNDGTTMGRTKQGKKHSPTTDTDGNDREAPVLLVSWMNINKGVRNQAKRSVVEEVRRDNDDER